MDDVNVLVGTALCVVMATDGGEFERFFRDEYRTVVRTVTAIVGDLADAEAISQDAFVKALIRWRRLSRFDRPGAWVRRVAIRDAVRAARSAQPPSEPAIEQGSPTDVWAERADLHDALQLLSINQRAALTLHYLAGLPVAEVAAALGCAEATVRVHLHRGRTRLAALLNEEKLHERR